MKIHAINKRQQAGHYSVTFQATVGSEVVYEHTSSIPWSGRIQDFPGMSAGQVQPLKEYTSIHTAETSWFRFIHQDDTQFQSGYCNLSKRRYLGATEGDLSNLDYLFKYLTDEDFGRADHQPTVERFLEYLLATIHRPNRQNILDALDCMQSNKDRLEREKHVRHLLKLSFGFFLWVLSKLEVEDLPPGNLLADLLWLVARSEAPLPETNLVILAISFEADSTRSWMKQFLAQNYSKLPRFNEQRLAQILTNTNEPSFGEQLGLPKEFQTKAEQKVHSNYVLEIREADGSIVPQSSKVPNFEHLFEINVGPFCICLTVLGDLLKVYSKTSGEIVLEEKISTKLQYRNHATWKYGAACILEDQSTQETSLMVVKMDARAPRVFWIHKIASDPKFQVDMIATGWGMITMSLVDQENKQEMLTSHSYKTYSSEVVQSVKLFSTTLHTQEQAETATALDSRQYEQAFVIVANKNKPSEKNPSKTIKHLHFIAHLLPSGYARRLQSTPEVLGEVNLPRVEQTFGVIPTYHSCFLKAPHPTYVTFHTTRTYSMFVFFKQRFIQVVTGKQLCVKAQVNPTFANQIRGNFGPFSPFIYDQEVQTNKTRVTAIRNQYPGQFGQTPYPTPVEEQTVAVDPILALRSNSDMFAIGRSDTRSGSIWMCLRQSEILLQVKQVRLRY